MKKSPLYMIIYECPECALKSGYTELDIPVCRYCKNEKGMLEVSKTKISAEVMSNRLKELSASMLNNLQSAFETMTEADKASFPSGMDPEKQMLLLLAKAKAFKENIEKLELKEPDDNQ